MYRFGIIPATKTQLGSHQIFSYKYPTKLAPGTLVRIPFGRRTIRGLVWDRESDNQLPQSKLKKISTVITGAPHFTKPTRRLLAWLGKYYYCSYGRILDAMLPRDMRRPRATVFSEKTALPLPEIKHKLNSAQLKAWKNISSALEKQQGKFLLHGVTGSGKTELYFRAVAKALKHKTQVLFLVPEIALTAQEHERLNARFPGRVHFWHSNLSASERFNLWQQIGTGEPMIVAGPRSAVLLPFKKLGLIVLDEEHDDSYKQTDLTPLYDARLAAEKLARFWPATLIAGTATPRLSTYYRAKEKKQFTLLTLNERIAKRPLPPVTILDLREVKRGSTRGIFSKHLESAMASTLATQKQILLFLNRRGAATSIICPNCGFVFMCPACNLPLTYHQTDGGRLRCHHCDTNTPLPRQCPSCHAAELKELGLGTQTVERALVNLFPTARIARMDSDTMQTKDAHHKLFTAFKTGEIDILIGTQMITKGWDIPQVDLIGVVLADTALAFPDYRSQERAFQILTQVAGRAGRGANPGQVLIQTYQPDNFALQAAARHDYKLFYDKEITERRALKYPPFAKLVLLTLSTKTSATGEKSALELTEDLLTFAEHQQLHMTQILGPTEGFIPRVRSRYVWQIILKGPAQELKQLLPKIPSTWKIDRDPVSTL